MHNGLGLFLLALVLIVPAGLFTARAVSRRARGSQGQPRAGGGIVTGWLAHRRAVRLKRIDHENATARDKARHEQRLREQAERDRRRGRPATVPGEAEWTTEATDRPWPDPPRHFGRGTIRPKWLRLRPESPGSGDIPGSPAAPPADPGPPPPARDFPRARPAPAPPGPSPVPEPPARGGSAPRPASPVPGPASPAGPAPAEPPTLEGVVVTMPDTTPGALAVPGVEMIIEGAQALRRHAMNGNASAKRATNAGIIAASDILAGITAALSREMAEPGQHYGPEVTEPLAMAATHFRAGGMALAEIDGRLAAIIRAAEELQARGVQAPHHEQFQER